MSRVNMQSSARPSRESQGAKREEGAEEARRHALQATSHWGALVCKLRQEGPAGPHSATFPSQKQRK